MWASSVGVEKHLHLDGLAANSLDPYRLPLLIWVLYREGNVTFL